MGVDSVDRHSGLLGVDLSSEFQKRHQEAIRVFEELYGLGNRGRFKSYDSNDKTFNQFQSLKFDFQDWISPRKSAFIKYRDSLSKPVSLEEQSKIDNFINSAQEYFQGLINSGAVSEEAAKAYCYLILTAPVYGERSDPFNLPFGEFLDFNEIRDVNEVMSDAQFQQLHSYLETRWKKTPSEKKEDQEGFYLYKGKEEKSDFRIYINPNKDHPLEVISAWEKALQIEGLGDKIRYKVKTTRDLKDDFIVVYISSDFLRNQMFNLLETFMGIADWRWMGRQPKGTVPLVNGIGVAVELSNAKEFSSIANEGKTGGHLISYRTSLAAFMNTAYFLADGDLKHQGLDQKNESFEKQLKAKTREYFIQFLKLSAINPETMLFKNEAVDQFMAQVASMRKPKDKK